MFVLTLEDHPDGVYSVWDESENRVIPIFLQSDDADRYLMMMSAEDTWFKNYWTKVYVHLCKQYNKIHRPSHIPH